MLCILKETEARYLQPRVLERLVDIITTSEFDL